MLEAIMNWFKSNVRFDLYNNVVNISMDKNDFIALSIVLVFSTLLLVEMLVRVRFLIRRFRIV